MKARLVVDAIGLICPLPLTKLSLAIKAVEVGDIVELRLDDDLSQKDVPSWCTKTGNSLLSVELHEEYSSFYIERTA